jgi:ABC-type transport system substrate-binding protein
MQSNFQQDVSITAVKNPTYWDTGKPYLDQVQLLYVADQMTREALFLSGGAEMLNAIPSEGQKFTSQGFKVLNRLAGPNALIPDSKNADSPYANIKVRLAVEAAIDRESLANTYGYGYGSASYQFATPAAMAFDPTLASQYRKYDVAKAKQLLTDAGYPNGFKTTIEVQPGVDNNPVLAVQSYLSKIGIQASLDFPQSSRWTILQTSPVPTSTLFYQPMAEAATFNTTVNVYFGDPGAFYFPSLKKADGWPALFAQDLTSSTADPAILKQVSDMFFNDCTIIPLFYSSQIVIVSPKIQDSGIGNYGNLDAWDFPNVWLSK